MSAHEQLDAVLLFGQQHGLFLSPQQTLLVHCSSADIDVDDTPSTRDLLEAHFAAVLSLPVDDAQTLGSLAAGVAVSDLVGGEIVRSVLPAVARPDVQPAASPHVEVVRVQRERAAIGPSRQMLALPSGQARSLAVCGPALPYPSERESGAVLAGGMQEGSGTDGAMFVPSNSVRPGRIASSVVVAAAVVSIVMAVTFVIVRAVG